MSHPFAEVILILNKFEWLMMNNPVRAAIQRRLEARRLLDMGGRLANGAALEVGCGRGVGIQLILDLFDAGRVDAFDLDERMVQLAKRRHRSHPNVRIWTGTATAIDSGEAVYDAVFDFGIIHHVPQWRVALEEIFRVLRPGGRLYAEEVLISFIKNPVWRRLLDHPPDDRFDLSTFGQALEHVGFIVKSSAKLGPWFGWIVADKPHS